MYKVITTTEELEEAAAVWARSGYVTIDTEFLRERTYWPQLCLVQIACEQGASAVDPLAKGISLEPLRALLEDPTVLKVMHAGKQDIEIFVRLFGEVPIPLYDTQLAAMVLGYGEQMGYEALIRKLTAHELDKSQQFTDWSRRPLSEAQLEYAIADVVYLREAYVLLRDELAQTERESWLDEELRKLADPALYATDPEQVWLRLKKRGNKPHYLARLRALAAWREHEAMRLDKPRGWVLNDDAVQEIAMTNPKNAASLRKGRMIGRHLSQLDLDVVMEVVQAANALPSGECPQLARGEGLPPEKEAARDLLRLLLREKCREHRIVPRLMASSDDLDALLLGKASPILEGWRYEKFGHDAEALLAGKLSLSLGKMGELRVSAE